MSKIDQEEGRVLGRNMGTYESFARVYDLFMDNVDYVAWGAYLHGLLKQYGVEEGLVLELGCGTGSMTEQLAAAGYDMIGLDSSEDMLELAQEKKQESGRDILYLKQDMREFELYGTVRAVISVCDSLNYILEEEELLQVFRLVNNYLDPGGIFLFDLNTTDKYRRIGEATIAENREEGSFIWENVYDEEEKLNEYQLTIFLQEGRQEDSLYRKYEEIHLQRAYEPGQIRQLLVAAGLEFVAAFEAFTGREPDEKSDRICYVARECKKKGEAERRRGSA